MRYQLIPDNPAEEAAVEKDTALRPLFDPFLPVLQARALIEAARLNLFEVVGRDARTVGQLSEALEVEKTTLDLLLRVLVCAGYLSRYEGLYRLTDVSLSHLLDSSPRSLKAWVQFNSFHWDVISGLQEALRTGMGVDWRQYFRTSADWHIQIRAMLETARPMAPWVASQIPVCDGASTLFDLGGGHGLYGAAICRENPPLHSYVLDCADVLEHASTVAAEDGFDDLVTYREGDILSDDLGVNTCDAVFMGNIVHHFTEEQIRALLAKVYGAMADGGTIAVWDMKESGPDSHPDLVTDGFALLFRLTSNAGCHSPKRLAELLECAGFVEIEIRPAPSSLHVLVIGRKR